MGQTEHKELQTVETTTAMSAGQAPALAHGSRRCQCAACGRYFKSDAGFDRHRVGPVEQRRCLTPGEMRRRGMAENAQGLWITNSMGGRLDQAA